MIAQPAILALLLSSVLVTAMMLYAAFFGVTVIRHWDISSGSDRQLALERRTYLVSSLLAWAFVLQIASLFLFVYTAEDLHSRFVGAELVLQAGFFLNMRPNIITSCCGSLFSGDKGPIQGDMAALPPGPMMILFWTTLALLLGTGFVSLKTRRAARFFALFAVAAFPVGAASLLSFISLYFYELPTHHCPFCLLKGEYGYVGYGLYATLLGGAIGGGGVGLLQPFRRIRSLALIVPTMAGRLMVLSMVCYALFAAISAWGIATASLTLGVL